MEYPVYFGSITLGTCDRDRACVNATIGMLELVAGPREWAWLEIKEVLLKGSLMKTPLSPQLGVEWR